MARGGPPLAVAAWMPERGQTGAVTESLPPGLYEVLVTEVLAEQLASACGPSCPGPG